MTHAANGDSLSSSSFTRDRSLSAHFELSVAVTPFGPWILSEPYPYPQAEAAFQAVRTVNEAEAMGRALFGSA